MFGVSQRRGESYNEPADEVSTGVLIARFYISSGILPFDPNPSFGIVYNSFGCESSLRQVAPSNDDTALPGPDAALEEAFGSVCSFPERELVPVGIVHPNSVQSLEEHFQRQKKQVARLRYTPREQFLH